MEATSEGRWLTKIDCPSGLEGIDTVIGSTSLTKV